MGPAENLEFERSEIRPHKYDSVPHMRKVRANSRERDTGKRLPTTPTCTETDISTAVWIVMS
ncbi:hypothetical protein GCM10018793_49930 [Streptomyces sulfonofaciens]|uniref:Uncharacterized protein n=1 Tax=Streptomyces sulfonofaciens TaxID=68272 RepID=A0A919GH89_9ACTN|nr:hypothetical protein GCM10018793_49930 [Streptomyces sulfonofaciens]